MTSPDCHPAGSKLANDKQSEGNADKRAMLTKKTNATLDAHICALIRLIANE
jgi:hypothetical protein